MGHATQGYIYNAFPFKSSYTPRSHLLILSLQHSLFRGCAQEPKGPEPLFSRSLTLFFTLACVKFAVYEMRVLHFSGILAALLGSAPQVQAATCKSPLLVDDFSGWLNHQNNLQSWVSGK